MSALHAPFCADNASQHTVEVAENVRLARDTYRVQFACAEIARRIVPGQFVMLRLAGLDDPLLGRPLALYDTVLSARGEPHAIDIVYLVTGKMTARLALYQAGQRLDLWGPLGNGFPPLPTEHLIMVAGGIGQTPFMALGREFLGLRQYGSPPRSRTEVKKGHLLLRRTPRRIPRGRRRLPRAWARCAIGDRRRLRRSSRPCHRRVETSPHGVARPDRSPRVPRRLLRPGENDGSGVRNQPFSGRPVPGFARNADGLRHRHLLHLRGEGEATRRRLGLPPHLR